MRPFVLRMLGYLGVFYFLQSGRAHIASFIYCSLYAWTSLREDTDPWALLHLGTPHWNAMQPWHPSGRCRFGTTLFGAAAAFCILPTRLQYCDGIDGKLPSSSPSIEAMASVIQPFGCVFFWWGNVNAPALYWAVWGSPWTSGLGIFRRFFPRVEIGFSKNEELICMRLLYMLDFFKNRNLGSMTTVNHLSWERRLNFKARRLLAQSHCLEKAADSFSSWSSAWSAEKNGSRRAVGEGSVPFYLFHFSPLRAIFVCVYLVWASL